MSELPASGRRDVKNRVLTTVPDGAKPGDVLVITGQGPPLHCLGCAKKVTDDGAVVAVPLKTIEKWVHEAPVPPPVVSTPVVAKKASSLAFE